MQMLRDRETGAYPVDTTGLRLRFPDTGLPEVLDAEALDFVGADVVEATAPPEYDAATHSIAEGGPSLVDGQWRQTWIIAALPAPEITPISVITMRQAKLMLHRVGLLTEIDARMAAMEGDAGIEARIEWEFGAELERDHPLVAEMGVPPEQVDSLFLWASAL